MPSRTKSCWIQILHVNSHEQCVWPQQTSQDYEQTQGGDGNINRDYRWTGFSFSIFGFKEKILVFSYCLLSKLASLCKLANHVGNSEGLYFKIKDWNDQWNTGFLCFWPQMVLSNFSGFPPSLFRKENERIFWASVVLKVPQDGHRRGSDGSPWHHWSTLSTSDPGGRHPAMCWSGSRGEKLCKSFVKHSYHQKVSSIKF